MHDNHRDENLDEIDIYSEMGPVWDSYYFRCASTSS